MTIAINLNPEDERKLSERAARNGQDVTSYVHGLIARDIQGVDEALAPFRREVEGIGISDDELGAFFEEVRQEIWQEKHGRPGQAT